MRGGTKKQNEQNERQTKANHQLYLMEYEYNKIENKIDINNIQNSEELLNYINDNVLKPIYGIQDFEISNVEVKQIAHTDAYIALPLSSGNQLHINMKKGLSQYYGDNIYQITDFSEQQ